MTHQEWTCCICGDVSDWDYDETEGLGPCSGDYIEFCDACRELLEETVKEGGVEEVTVAWDDNWSEFCAELHCASGQAFDTDWPVVVDADGFLLWPVFNDQRVRPYTYCPTCFTIHKAPPERLWA